MDVPSSSWARVSINKQTWLEVKNIQNLDKSWKIDKKETKIATFIFSCVIKGESYTTFISRLISHATLCSVISSSNGSFDLTAVKSNGSPWGVLSTGF